MNRESHTVKDKRHHFNLWIIRSLLIISAFIDIIYIIVLLINKDYTVKSEMMAELNSKVELLFYAAITFGATYVHDFFEHRRIHIPHVLETILIIYIYAATFLSKRYHLYYEYIWWDMILHAFAGAVLGFLGFLAIYKINMRYSMNISPLLTAIFAFGFSLALTVFFEIYEFSYDAIFGTALQSWDLPENMLEIGKPYQGAGLRDTMSDLICDYAGALINSVFCFYLYKHKKRKALHVMHEMFPAEKKKRRLFARSG